MFASFFMNEFSSKLGTYLIRPKGMKNSLAQSKAEFKNCGMDEKGDEHYATGLCYAKLVKNKCWKFLIELCSKFWLYSIIEINIQKIHLIKKIILKYYYKLVNWYIIFKQIPLEYRFFFLLFFLLISSFNYVLLISF